MQPSTFTFEHLPADLQEISKPCCELALKVYDEIPDCDEREAALRFIMQAKDCLVRAKLENRS